MGVLCLGQNNKPTQDLNLSRAYKLGIDTAAFEQ